MTGTTETWLRRAAAVVTAESERLTRLDAAIGDGDHGINLSRGFAALVRALDASVGPAPGPVPLTGPAAVLALAGRTLMGMVGGASGALYGRAFARASATLEGATDPTPAQVADALDAANAAIGALGRSEPGQKTMLDALTPGAAAFRSTIAAGGGLAAAFAACADAAEAGAAATIPMLATRGRASYLGERSIGHLDPGAASSALLLRALADVVAAEA